jgi:hypothetical protein
VSNKLLPPPPETVTDSSLVARCAQLEDELDRLVMRERILSAKNRQLVQQQYLLQENIKSVSERGRQLALELDLFRQRRLVRFCDRFRNLFDAWHLMRPEFNRLKDDSVLFNGSLKGFRLLPSANLMRVPFLNYRLILNRPMLSGILLAPVLDFPASDGEIVVRISVLSNCSTAKGKFFSNTGDDSSIYECSEVLAEVSAPLVGISDEAPVALRFPAIAQSGTQPLVVQISVRGTEVPVRVFELRRLPWRGLLRCETRLFAGFFFD